MIEWRINFGQNLRHLRQVYGLTQREMAEILGVSVSTYGKIERCDPSVRTKSGHICRLCDHFQISPDEILEENWPEMLSSR